ncbi:MAG: hypothetical protein AB7S36_03200, partial [Planctomycetota bacterium]
AVESGDPTQIRHTFGAPRGTVRALLALCVAGSAYWLIANPDLRPSMEKLPDELLSALLIIISYYFADRAAASGARQEGPSPLWLPQGTVRAMLVVGFLAAVGWLIYQQVRVDPAAFNFWALPGAAMIVNIGAFLGGRLGKAIIKGFHNQGKSSLAHVIDDIKAVVAIIAAVGVVLVFCVPQIGLPQEWKLKFSELLPSIITFYFGTK